jgi:hypothetical protein
MIYSFTSDHGDLLGEHAKMNKGSPYKTSAGIPFILRYPAKVKGGKIIESATTSVDFAQTILNLMNIKPPKKAFQGINVAPEILSKKRASNDIRVRYMMDAGKSVQWTAAFQQQYKVVISDTDVPWLFDLNKDPNELINFFDHPDYDKIKTDLLIKLQRFMKKYKVPMAKKYSMLLWSTPECLDSSDRVPLFSSSTNQAATCSDLNITVSLDSCDQQHWQQACPVTCGTCCKDSEGPIWIKGMNKGSLQYCADMTRLWCTEKKTWSFCPQTCGRCIEDNIWI